MAIVMPAVWWRTSRSSYSHQIRIPVHFVRSLSLWWRGAGTGLRGRADLFSQVGPRRGAWAGTRRTCVDVLESWTQLSRHDLPAARRHAGWREWWVGLGVAGGWRVAAGWAKAQRLTVGRTVQAGNGECRPGASIHQLVEKWVVPVTVILTWWCYLDPRAYCLGTRPGIV